MKGSDEFTDQYNTEIPESAQSLSRHGAPIGGTRVFP